MLALQCFTEGSVVCDLKNPEKYDAIHELIERSDIFRDRPDRVVFEKAVIQREKLLSTGMGHGAAVAHGQLSSIDGVQIALGISPGGIDFESHDGKPVFFLFLVASALQCREEYLAVISAIAKMIRVPAFQTELLGCRGPEEAREYLKRKFRQTYQPVGCLSA